MQTQKSFSARIICSKEQLKELWELHQAYHRRLRSFIGLLQSALDGNAGGGDAGRAEFYKNFIEFILASDAKNAKYLFNGVCLDKWVPNSANKIEVKIKQPDGETKIVRGDSLTGQAIELLQSGHKLFDKEYLMRGLPRWAGEFILNDSVAVLSGHQSLHALWASKHGAWERAREKWELDHGNYMKVSEILMDFDSSEAKFSVTRDKRWHKVIEFFRSRPDLADWRGAFSKEGKKPQVFDYTDEDREAIRNASKTKRSGLQVKLFFKNNPELDELNKIHREYKKNYAPKRFKRGRQWIETDGFDRPPQFTLPDAIRHPRWLWLNGEQTSPTGYKIEKLPKVNKAGKVLIQLYDKKSGEAVWLPFPIRGDNRFDSLVSEMIEVEMKKRAKEVSEEIPEDDSPAKKKLKRQYHYHDPHLAEAFEAALKSTRLRFQIDYKTGQPESAYLDFSIKRESREPSELAKAVQFVPVKAKETRAAEEIAEENALDATGETSDAAKKTLKRMKLPDGITVAFIHPGITTAAYACLATGRDGQIPTILNVRKLWLSHFNESRGKWQGEPKLKKILAARRLKKEKQRTRFRLTKGEVFDQNLARHLRGVESDRYKKTARRIVEYARGADGIKHSASGLELPPADILVVGDFADVRQSKSNPRFLNELISIWKLPEIIALSKDLGREAGIPVFTKSAWGCSRVCSKCGALGKRYLLGREIKDDSPKTKQKREQPRVVFTNIGRHFACPECGYMENAEFNAVINQAKSVFLPEWLDEARKFVKLPRKEQAEWHKSAEENLKPKIEKAL